MSFRLILLQVESIRATPAWLKEKGWECVRVKGAPETPGDGGVNTVVLFAPKKIEELNGAALRALFPHAWICLWVKSTWMDDKKTDLSGFDELWPQAFDTDYLKASLPRWESHLERINEIRSLQQEAELLKHQCESLILQSGQIVNQMEHDVELATRIQRSLHPKALPALPGIHLQTKFLPAAGSGGDYYDVFQFGDGRLGILLADSKSHGMAASLLTVLIKIRLEEMKERFADTRVFVEHLNQELQIVHGKTFSSVSLLYGILDRKTLTFQYTVAGQLSPLLWRLGELTPLTTIHNPALGEVSDFSFKESFITLKPADLLLFSTDGLDAPLGGTSLDPALRAQKLAELLKHAEPSPDLLGTQNEILALVDKHFENRILPDDITLIQLFVEAQTLYVASESK